MKHLKLFEEYISEPIDVYHGSDRNFDTFDLNKIGSGDGKNIGGWGFYFSDSEEVARRYFLKSGFVKEFRLKSGNYFNLDEYLYENEAQEILSELKRNDDISEDDIEQFQTDFIEYISDITNKQVYEWLSYTLKSQKNASLFLKDMGYKGNKFKDKILPEATNYVIYDINSIIYL